MHLSPTPEQQALKDAVARFCREQITPERLQAWEREPRRIDAALLAGRRASSAGSASAVPEARGGSGLGPGRGGLRAAGVRPRADSAQRHQCHPRRRGRWRGSIRTAPSCRRSRAASAVVALAFDEQRRATRRASARTLSGGAAARGSAARSGTSPTACSADLHLVAAREGERRRRWSCVARRARRGARRCARFDGEEQAIVRYDDSAGRCAASTPAGQGAAALRALQRSRSRWRWRRWSAAWTRCST